MTHPTNPESLEARAEELAEKIRDFYNAPGYAFSLPEILAFARSVAREARKSERGRCIEAVWQGWSCAAHTRESCPGSLATTLRSVASAIRTLPEEEE